MKKEEIKAMQRRIGVEADGAWGPVSREACKAHLRALMPKESPWPKGDQESLREFYGAPGDESQLVTFEFPFPMYYEGKLVKTGRCHWRVKASLLRILGRIGTSYHRNRDVMEEAEDYGGIYNFRNKRGGTTYSVHAWGAAIDLDADDNTFRDTWPINADMPLEIMEEFAREGWTAAGAFWGYDAMHFQATQP